MKLRDFAGSEGVKELKRTLNTFWMILTDEYNGKFGNDAMIAHYNENVQVGFNGDDPVAWLESRSYNSPENWGSEPPKPTNSPTKSSNLNSDQVKEQVRCYMEQNDIFSLTLDNGKLIIKYNNSSTKAEKEINSEDLKTIQNYLKEHNNSVNYEQIKFNYPTTNQDKKSDYTPWIVSGGILVLVAIFVYWIIRKSKRLPSK